MDKPVTGNLCMRLNRQVYLLYDEDYNNDNDNGGEDIQNKLSVLMGIYLQPSISNCTNKTCRHINYFCLLSCLKIKNKI
jgi:hypothetical protein